MGHPRTAVAQWHALKAWVTQRPNCLQCFSLSEFSISLSVPNLSTHPLLPKTAVLGYRKCVISLFSGLFDIPCPDFLWHTFLKFHPSQVLIPPWTPHPFVWTQCLWCLHSLPPCTLFMWDLFFSRYPSAILCLTSEQYLPLAPHEYNYNYEPKMDQTDVPTILCGGKTGCIQTCTWVWMVPTCATHLPPKKGNWTRSGHSTHVWSFLTFHSFSDTTVIILLWLEPFVVCACCGWCAVTPNVVLQQQN